MKNIMTLCMAAILLSAAPVFSQTSQPVQPKERKANLERLISQNYINIRDIRSPLINYGGGQKQHDQLLAGFSAAFSKYLAEKFDEAYTLFEKNNQDINDAAAQVAAKYQQDTDALYTQLVHIALKDRMGKSASRSTVEFEMDLSSSNDFYLKSAAHLLRIGDQKLAEKNPFEAIFYYRKSKQYIFQSYTEMGIKPDSRFTRDIADMHDEVYTGAEKLKEK
jgi:hypothetical protein